MPEHRFAGHVTEIRHDQDVASHYPVYVLDDAIEIQLTANTRQRGTPQRGDPIVVTALRTPSGRYTTRTVDVLDDEPGPPRPHRADPRNRLVQPTR